MRTLGSWDNSESGPAWLVDFKSIDEELRYLRRMVNTFRGNPEIRNLAVTIIQGAGAPQKDKRAQAIALADWVQQHIYYVHELPERFQLPTETLRLKAGDCDDSTTLLCSLLEAIGIPSALVCMRINGVYSHIFPGAWLKSKSNDGAISFGGVARLLPLDTTMSAPVTSLPNPVEWAQGRGKTVALKIV